MLYLKKYIAIFSLALISLSQAVAQDDTYSAEEVLVQNKVRNYLIGAREYLKSGKEDLAKIELDNALDLAPENWVANTLMGDLMYDRGDYLHALLSYDKAILVNTRDPTLYYKRAKLHIKLNNHRAYIVGDYDRAIALAPTNNLYYIRKAFYYAHSVNPKNFKTDYTAAINTINDALIMDANDPELLNLKSKYLLGNDQNLAALTEINKAIVIVPTNDAFLAQRGHVNYKIARYKAALTDFSRAIKIYNQNSNYFIYRGHSNFNLDRYADAYNDYSSAMDLVINKIAVTRGSVSYNGTLNKELRSLLLFRGMSLVHDNRPYDGCDDFKRASQMGETKARNYISQYCN
jgi:tetratricopeptide (TPR) repeat protein